MQVFLSYFKICFFLIKSNSKGIANVSLQYDVPITFGIVTADTVEQAIDRAGLKHGNKGFEVAKTAIEMVNLVKKI